MTTFQSLTDSFELSNGVKIPCVGFGTWQIDNGEPAYESVRVALEAGYRHIDTAQGYGNEESVGKAIRDSGIPREEIFLTTKLDNQYRGFATTLQMIQESMKLLQTDYIDLFLIHWPNPKQHRPDWQGANADTWRAFENAHEKGWLRSLGVSNFLPHHVEALMETAQIIPHVNQVKLAPGFTQDNVRENANEFNILLEAYSPLGTGEILDNAELLALADKYGKTAAQVALRWSLQMGFLPLPKSETAERIRKNAQIFDFELADEDVKKLENLDTGIDMIMDPDA